MTKCRSNLVKFDMVKSWSVLVMKGNNLSTGFRKLSLGAVVFFFFHLWMQRIRLIHGLFCFFYSVVIWFACSSVVVIRLRLSV